MPRQPGELSVGEAGWAASICLLAPGRVPDTAHLLGARHGAPHWLFIILFNFGLRTVKEGQPALGGGRPSGETIRSQGLEVGKPGVDFGKMSLECD